VNTLLLLLLDSRAPAGAHHHSGGMEAAVGTGLVTGLAGLEDFCRARLRTSARVSAAFAAAACLAYPERTGDQPAVGREFGPLDAGQPGDQRAVGSALAVLDAELDARLASEAMRAASRQLGRGLLRLLRALVPDLRWDRFPSPAPHHPLVLGAGVSRAGGDPALAGRAAALAACAGPASAAVRLLGLDPFAVQAMLARLAPEIDGCAASAAAAAASPPSELPADGAPALDLLADYHLTAEVRLFAS
jgi:urease accessory protein